MNVLSALCELQTEELKILQTVLLLVNTTSVVVHGTLATVSCFLTLKINVEIEFSSYLLLLFDYASVKIQLLLIHPQLLFDNLLQLFMIE